MDSMIAEQKFVHANPFGRLDTLCWGVSDPVPARSGKHDRRGLLLDRIHPAPMGIKDKVPWSISRRERNKRGVRWAELAGLPMESINVNTVLPQVRLQHEPIRRI